jgi:hypothetical protein
LLLVLACAVLAPIGVRAHTDGEGGELPVAHLAGGGPPANDCLAGLEVVGVRAKARARTVPCEDGDPICDRDRLANGRCLFWVRVCLNQEGAGCPRAVTSAAIEAAGDEDLSMLGRTLELVKMPAAAAGTCGALTTLTVPLSQRGNGSSRKGRKLVRWRAAGAGAGDDADAVTFLCRPPAKEKRRDAISFALIEKRIFARSCAASGCHGVTNPQANLTLVGDAAYANLVDRVAATDAAQFAGKKLVVPGAPETSFLLDKLLGKLGPDEGQRMPLGRGALADEQIAAIRTWIAAGAPRQRSVEGRLALADRQPRIPNPAPPPGGYQAHLTPFAMGDLPETEGCQVVRLDNPDDIFAGAWELFMHEGSHHFILRAFRCRDRDGNGANDCDEPDFDGRFPAGFRPCEEFGSNWAFVVGSQTPHFLVDYQTEATGVAFGLHRRQPLLLNSHYTNPFSDTLAEVWVNVTPVDPAQVRHPARILFETIANAFIKVPPGARSAAATYLSCAFTADPFCALSGEPTPTASHFALLGVTSHMHKRSTKFVTDLFPPGKPRLSRGADDMIDPDDGAPHLYVSTDYSDPVNLTFWPPLVVEQGTRLTYQCFHDNGVDEPVRLGCEEQAGVPPGRSIVEQFASGAAVDIYAGAARWCRTDADCAGFGTGRCVPANLVFGELADDDMCILPGLYYPCRGDAATCLE